jgi:hypothetical protein
MGSTRPTCRTKGRKGKGHPHRRQTWVGSHAPQGLIEGAKNGHARPPRPPSQRQRRQTSKLAAAARLVDDGWKCDTREWSGSGRQLYVLRLVTVIRLTGCGFWWLSPVSFEPTNATTVVGGADSWCAPIAARRRHFCAPSPPFSSQAVKTAARDASDDHPASQLGPS